MLSFIKNGFFEEIFMDGNFVNHQSVVSEIINKDFFYPESFAFSKLSPLLIRFLNQLKKSGKSINTISAYRNDLSLFCEFLIEKQISPDNYSYPAQENWLHFLKENGRHSQSSMRRAQMSVRTFIHFMVSEKIITNSPFLDIKSPKQPAPALLTVTHEKYLSLCRTLKQLALNKDEKAIRDWTLILILGECGLKASEASNLTWGDVWPELEDPTSESSIAGCLKVTGNNERLVPYNPEVARALTMLKETREQMSLSTCLESKLFFGYLNVSRKTRTNFLHRHGIKFVIYEVCTEILGIPYNSESLRNHAILRWLSKGMDNEKVANLAGYSSLNSLERFLNSKERKKISPRKLKSLK
jgi:integrase/recombinase XerD